jgi:hypothetical protein
VALPGTHLVAHAHEKGVVVDPAGAHGRASAAHEAALQSVLHAVRRRQAVFGIAADQADLGPGRRGLFPRDSVDGAGSQAEPALAALIGFIGFHLDLAPTFF